MTIGWFRPSGHWACFASVCEDLLEKQEFGGSNPPVSTNYYSFDFYLSHLANVFGT